MVSLFLCTIKVSSLISFNGYFKSLQSMLSKYLDASIFRISNLKND